MILRNYTQGETLAENEYLFKLRNDNTGFLTKLTKKGELPKAFEEWGGMRYGENGKSLPIYVFEETAMSGWKIVKWRFGQSQNWATMRHPEGFTVEIYLQQLLELIQTHTVDAGVLIGKFYWKDNKLIKE